MLAALNMINSQIPIEIQLTLVGFALILALFALFIQLRDRWRARNLKKTKDLG